MIVSVMGLISSPTGFIVGFMNLKPLQLGFLTRVSIIFILLDLCSQDLKNLRSQLYSAAEYFELSYTNDDQKQM